MHPARIVLECLELVDRPHLVSDWETKASDSGFGRLQIAILIARAIRPALEYLQMYVAWLNLDWVLKPKPEDVGMMAVEDEVSTAGSSWEKGLRCQLSHSVEGKLSNVKVQEAGKSLDEVDRHEAKGGGHLVASGVERVEDGLSLDSRSRTAFRKVNSHVSLLSRESFPAVDGYLSVSQILLPIIRGTLQKEERWKLAVSVNLAFLLRIHSEDSEGEILAPLTDVSSATAKANGAYLMTSCQAFT